MKKLTTNEMAVLRYRVMLGLLAAAESLKDPAAPFKNVCNVMDSLSYFGDMLDDIRHSAHPEWFSEEKV